MRLLGPEKKQLQQALLGAFQRAELAALVDFYLDERLGKIASDTDDDRAATLKLIYWTEDQGKLEALLDGAPQEVPGNATLVAVCKLLLANLRQRHPPPWYQPADHVQTCFLPGRRAFIDRKELRRALKELIGGGSRVLAVNGPRRSGKSYTLQLISYLASELQAYQYAVINLEQERTTQLSPEAMMESIGLQLALSDLTLPSQRREEPRRARILCDWLVGKNRQSARIWWVVLDGFHHPDVPEPTRELIQYLVGWVAENVCDLRVVLLTYTEDLLPVHVRRYVRYERITEISRVDLVEFFQRVFDDRGEEYQQELVEGEVDRIVGSESSSLTERLDEIAQAVEEAAEVIFQ